MLSRCDTWIDDSWKISQIYQRHQAKDFKIFTVSNKIKKTTNRHIIVKLLKDKDKTWNQPKKRNILPTKEQQKWWKLTFKQKWWKPRNNEMTSSMCWKQRIVKLELKDYWKYPSSCTWNKDIFKQTKHERIHVQQKCIKRNTAENSLGQKKMRSNGSMEMKKRMKTIESTNMWVKPNKY